MPRPAGPSPRSARHRFRAGSRAGWPFPTTRCCGSGPPFAPRSTLGRSANVEVVFASGPPFSALVAGAQRRTRLARAVRRRHARWLGDQPRGRPSHEAARTLLRAPRAAHASAGFGRHVHDARHRRGGEAFRRSGHPRHPERVRFGRLALARARSKRAPEDRLHGQGVLRPLRSNAIPGVARRVSRQTDGPASRIEFDLVGTWPAGMEQAVARLDLGPRVRLHQYMPHREALALVAKADLGLVLIADRPGAAGSAPAKLYEYLGMGLPTLLIGPAGGYPAQVLEPDAGRFARRSRRPRCTRRGSDRAWRRRNRPVAGSSPWIRARSRATTVTSRPPSWRTC